MKENVVGSALIGRAFLFRRINVKTYSNKISSAERIDWIDLAKGLAIILVIISHTVGGILRGMIFSFHMPLFFMLSSITYRCSNNEEQFVRKTEKAFKHLMFPAIIMFCLNVIICFFKNQISLADMTSVKIFVKESILTAVFASGVDVKVLDSSIYAIGIPWFLVVLFIGRTLFDYINLRLKYNKMVITCIILSVIGVLFGKIQWLPLSFDIVLAVLPFFVLGNQAKKNNFEKNAILKFIISFVVWILLFVLTYRITSTYLELACRRYTLYPICYIIAVCGSIMVSEFSVLLCRLKSISKPLIYLGKNSLYMLCIHILDFNLWTWAYEITGNNYVNAMLRVLVDCIVFGLVMMLMRIAKRRNN